MPAYRGISSEYKPGQISLADTTHTKWPKVICNPKYGTGIIVCQAADSDAAHLI
jgi:hypothetical protein